jgi:hypothetical protein
MRSMGGSAAVLSQIPWPESFKSDHERSNETPGKKRAEHREARCGCIEYVCIPFGRGSRRSRKHAANRSIRLVSPRNRAPLRCSEIRCSTAAVKARGPLIGSSVATIQRSTLI